MTYTVDLSAAIGGLKAELRHSNSFTKPMNPCQKR